MISKSLQFTRNVLDQFLKNRFGEDDSIVILNKLIENNGSAIQANQNKVVISLINIEKETAKPFYVRNQKLSGGGYSNINPAERFNLDILISANFDDYVAALTFLNAAILFFQQNSYIDQASFPGMPDGLSKLEYEIEKITYHQMQNLWTAMGVKYLPSVIYKIRLVTIEGGETEGFVSEIAQTAGNVAS